jgi:TonB family protein
MKAFIEYQIEVALCMAALTLFYLWLWRKDTNFIAKRLLLLGIPLIAIALPLLNIHISFVQQAQSTPIQYLLFFPNQLDILTAPTTMTNEPDWNIWELAFVIWSLGVVIMLTRLLVSYSKIWLIYQKSELSNSGEFRIVDSPIQSFSFFNLIMINREQAASGEKEYILTHEKAHSRQWHSCDILFLEIIKMLHWFNPIIWLITRESKQNMEYLADREVSEKTQNLSLYQYAIVQHAANSGYQLLKTQFSKSNLKNRIIMMNQPNNRKVQAWKLAIFLPITSLLFFSFSMEFDDMDIRQELLDKIPIIKNNNPLSIQQNSMESDQVQKDTIKSATEEIFSVVDEQPVPTVGLTAYMKTLQKNLLYPEKAKSMGIEGKVFVQFIVMKDGKLNDVKVVKGIGAGCDEEAVRVIREGPAWSPGKQRGKEVNVRMILPVKFGFIDNISGTVSTDDGTPIPNAYVLIKGTTIGTITDVNGRFEMEVKPEHNEIFISSIGFESRTEKVRKGENYIIKMNNSGSTNGQAPGISMDDNKISIRPSGQNLFESIIKTPLYIVDGVEIEDLDFTSLDPNDIQSITVLKDTTATNQYGEKAKNGVIIIKKKQ